MEDEIQNHNIMRNTNSFLGQTRIENPFTSGLQITETSGYGPESSCMVNATTGEISMAHTVRHPNGRAVHLCGQGHLYWVPKGYQYAEIKQGSQGLTSPFEVAEGHYRMWMAYQVQDGQLCKRVSPTPLLISYLVVAGVSYRDEETAIQGTAHEYQSVQEWVQAVEQQYGWTLDQVQVLNDDMTIGMLRYETAADCIMDEDVEATMDRNAIVWPEDAYVYFVDAEGETIQFQVHTQHHEVEQLQAQAVEIFVMGGKMLISRPSAERNPLSKPTVIGLYVHNGEVVEVSAYPFKGLQLVLRQLFDGYGAVAGLTHHGKITSPLSRSEWERKVYGSVTRAGRTTRRTRRRGERGVLRTEQATSEALRLEADILDAYDQYLAEFTSVGFCQSLVGNDSYVVVDGLSYILKGYGKLIPTTMTFEEALHASHLRHGHTQVTLTNCWLVFDYDQYAVVLDGVLHVYGKAYEFPGAYELKFTQSWDQEGEGWGYDGQYTAYYEIDGKRIGKWAWTLAQPALESVTIWVVQS